MISPSNKVNFIDQLNDEDDTGINFDLSLSFLARNKKSIASISAIITIISGLSFFIQKKIWLGEFQIVLENNNSMSSNNINPISEEMKTAQRWLGGKSSNFLDTEVGKLESSSVLMPIFEFVKNEKLKNDKSYAKLRFKDWKNKNLGINLIKGTSILEVSYQDSDRELILPVLKRISSGYQSYSGKKRLRSIELSKKFFNEQIEIYKLKSLNSFRKAEEFALKHNLTIEKTPLKRSFSLFNNYGLEGFSRTGSASSNVDGQINVEVIRIRNEEIIRNSEITLEEIENMGNDLTNIVYIAKSADFENKFIEGVKNILVAIDKLDREIALKKIKFRDTDDSIINLQNSRRSLALLLKNKTVNHLESKIKNAQINLRYAKRPKDVLIKYRQLLNQSIRDQNTLSDLEINFRQITFEDSRKTDPWELITRPTIFDKPIYPRLRNFILIGLIGGFFIGCYILILIENKSKIIYSSSVIRNKSQDSNNFNYEVSFFDADSIKEILNNNLQSSLVKKDEKIAIILLSENKTEITKNFKSSIKTISNNQKVNLIIPSELDETYAKSVLVLQLGITNKIEVNQVKWKLKLNDIKNLGYLSLKDIESKENEVDIIKEIILKSRNFSKKFSNYITVLISGKALSIFSKKFSFYLNLFRENSSNKINKNPKS